MDDSYQIPESLLRTNAPIELFAVNGKPVKVSALGCDRAEQWLADHVAGIEAVDREIELLDKHLKRVASEHNLAEVGDVDKALDAEKELRGRIETAKAKRFTLIRDSLKAYSPEVLTDEVVGAANVAQIVASFKRLLTVTDPTTAGIVLELARIASIRGTK